LVGLQSAEQLDKERQDARQQVDAKAKEERQERARKNAEVVAQQKVRLVHHSGASDAQAHAQISPFLSGRLHGSVAQQK